MPHPCSSFGGLVWLPAGIVVLGLSLEAQTPAARVSTRSTAPARSATVPRAADGHPDLQGTWDFAQLTPLERPSEVFRFEKDVSKFTSATENQPESTICRV